MWREGAYQSLLSSSPSSAATPGKLIVVGDEVRPPTQPIQDPIVVGKCSAAVSIPAVINNQRCSCLVDSGSVLALMPAEAPAVSNFGLSIYVSKPLISANGLPLVVRITCSLPVHIGKHSVVQEFLVVENLSAGPLSGSDFLQSHGVNLNFSSNFFSWSDSAVPFESSHLPCRLVLTDIIQIPSQSSCLCKGQVQTYDGVPLDAGVRLFQHGERLTGMGIIAAPVLVDGGTGTVPVHLVNFNHGRNFPKA